MVLVEKSYNFTSKAAAGIIGFTREKKAVALWDIIKHEKDRYVAFIKEMAGIGEEGDELNLHHDFNVSAGKKSLERVQQLIDYIKTIGNPFMFGNKLINIITHEELTFESEYLLNCIPFGDKLYADFVKYRLELKTISLFATISSKYNPVNHDNRRVQRTAKKEPSKEIENNKATRYIEYALSRGKTLEYMFEFPIT